MLEPVEVLAAMITPAVLISAAALLLLSTANRLGRVNDLIHRLTAKFEQPDREDDPSGGNGDRHELVLEQLASLLKRLLLLRTAVTGMYIAIALLAVTSIAAGMCVAFAPRFSPIPTAFGLLGVVAFLYSTVLLIREASLAVHETVREITYVRTLLHRQRYPEHEWQLN